MTDTPTTYVRIRASDDLTHHRPQFVYEARCPIHSTPEHEVICQLTSNINESIIWCDDEIGCRTIQAWTQMRKSFQAQATSFARVWHDTDTPNLTTGRVETDARKFARHLADESKRAEDRLHMPVSYEPVDLTDRDALGVTDEGMDVTHDQQVRTGQKDSRGRFVWTV